MFVSIPSFLLIIGGPRHFYKMGTGFVANRVNRTCRVPWKIRFRVIASNKWKREAAKGKNNNHDFTSGNPLPSRVAVTVHDAINRGMLNSRDFDRPFCQTNTLPPIISYLNVSFFSLAHSFYLLLLSRLENYLLPSNSQPIHKFNSSHTLLVYS